MTDLAEYYKEEQNYLHSASRDFIKQHSHLAHALGISYEQILDNDIKLLMESFAFLCAKLNKNIKDHVPEIASQLLQVLHPGFASDIPSFCLSQAVCEDDDKSYVLLPGTLLMINDIYKFRVYSSTIISPLILTEVSYVNNHNNASAIRIDLKTPGCLFKDLKLPYLDIYLAQDADKWLALMMASNKIEIKAHTTTTHFDVLEHHIMMDEAQLLDLDPLQELISCVDKFKFLRIQNNFSFSVSTLSIFVYIKEVFLPPVLVKDSWYLNCCMLVNVFNKVTEPIKFEAKKTRYPLQIDLRYNTAVQRITKVFMLDANYNPVELPNYFALNSLYHDEKTLSWFSEYFSNNWFMQIHTEQANHEAVVYAEVACHNADLISKLKPNISLYWYDELPLKQVKLIGVCSPSLPFTYDSSTMWQAIKLISSDQFSFLERSTIDHLLALYNKNVKNVLFDKNTLVNFVTTRQARFIPNKQQVFKHTQEGHVIDIDVKLDNGFFLCAALSMLIAKHSYMHHFTQVRMLYNNKLVYSWPVRLGYVSEV